MTRGAQLRAVLVAAAAAAAVAILGGTLTDVGPWYQSLRKPDWKPPDAAFGVIWTVIFALAAASGVIAWRRASRAMREWLIGLFALNGFANLLWSLLFFRLRRPDWAFVEVSALWLTIIGLIWATGRSSRLAAWLLAPYLLWVSIAALLNYDVARANGPFG